MTPSLPDILEGGLDIVFVGINPGTFSAQAGHYYAQPTNRFWRLLYKSGCVPLSLSPEDDWKLPRFGIGLTDVVKRVTSGAHQLSKSELKRGGEVLFRKVCFYQPRIVCFNGLTAYSMMHGQEKGPGVKTQKINHSHVFVIPSTSARNAQYTENRLLSYFTQLLKFRDDSH